MLNNLVKKRVTKFKKYRFLFSELVNRDFQQKYKRTILGMFWSILSPLLNLLIMKIVFTQFFGKDSPHYTTYLFSGNLILAFFKEATQNGMRSLMENNKIISKINVPKYLFLLSKNVSALVNFSLTLCVYFLFCFIDGIHFGPHMLALLLPTVCLVIMNIGVGMILSALFVFFRDIQYLYDVFLTLLTYVSAIFYKLDRFPAAYQKLFLLNPVYVIINYYRTVVISGAIPSLPYHGLMLFYSAFFLILGSNIYKKYNTEFVYYF